MQPPEIPFPASPWMQWLLVIVVPYAAQLLKARGVKLPLLDFLLRFIAPSPAPAPAPPPATPSAEPLPASQPLLAELRALVHELRERLPGRIAPPPV